MNWHSILKLSKPTIYDQSQGRKKKILRKSTEMRVNLNFRWIFENFGDVYPDEVREL